MSVRVMAWVLRNSEETLGNRLVLLVLADYAHDDGTGAFPSVPRIASDARLSERQTMRCLKELRGRGSIIATGSMQSGTVVYRVVTDEPSSYSGDPPDILSGGDIYSTGGVTSTTETPDRMSPEPPVTTSEPPLAAKAARAKTDYVWEGMEKVFGPVTNDGARARRNKAVKLVKQSLEAAAILEPPLIEAEIVKRARQWQQMFTNAPLTDIALANGWDRAALRAPASASRKRRSDPEPEPLSPEENAKRLQELRAAMQSIGKEIP